MKIADINLKIILDSRLKETLEVELFSGDFSAIASVPIGKSTGAHEAFALEPKKAVEKFKEIKSHILGREFNNQEEFDNFLIKLDGTEDKSNLGGNLILTLSLAFARLKAKEENLELFQYLRGSTSPKLNSSILGGRASLKFPRPIFNVINGGSHATNKESKLDFQEFQIIPEANDFSVAFSLGKIFYRKLGDYLRQKFGSENVVLGDEAGYCAPFKNTKEALEVIAEVIEKYNYPLRIGLDAAASQFYQQKEGHYLIGGEKYSAEELKDYYLKLIEVYDIISIEDPFYEEDFDSFASLTRGLGEKNKYPYKLENVRIFVDKSVLVIGDDLITTNPKRLRIAIEKKSGNAILIKPNQIGTLTETLRVVKLAYENNWQAIVSHRSGETTDDFIADLAVGVGAWGLKAGAPAKSERLVKYERLMRIYECRESRE